MINKLGRIFVILSLLVLVSCSESIDIQLDPEVSVFLKSNSEKTIQLTAEDEEYTVLKQWLSEHRSDWYVTSGRFPGGVFIKTGDYGIQVTELHVILYLMTSTKPEAINIQKIEKSDLSVIKKMGQ